MAAWYVLTKSLIQLTMALCESPPHALLDDWYSMSSMPGSVMPSLDQPPPCAIKYLACAAPDEDAGRAKW